MNRSTLVVLLSLSHAVLAAPKIGDRPPEIHFDKILPERPVANVRFEALTGKAVVLEMWATWCGACVEAIPHLNELAERFKDRPVVFLSVTDEEPELVARFLKTRPIGGWVGIAHTQSALSAYGVEGLPATFLIDSTGKIAGSTDPDMLSASMVEDLIDGKPLPPVELSIQPFRSNTIFTRTGLNSIVMHGASVQSVVARLWEVQESRIGGAALERGPVYDISLSIPVASATEFPSWAREVLAAAFHLQVKRETRESDAWILGKTEGKPRALEAPGTISDLSNLGLFPAQAPATGELLKLTNAEVSFIARFLESALKRPLIDESGISGKYDIQVSFEKNDPESVIEAMRKAGFKIEAGRRKVEFLEVKKAE